MDLYTPSGFLSPLLAFTGIDPSGGELYPVGGSPPRKTAQDRLLDALCEALERVLPVYRAAITLYDPERDTISILALSPHWKSEYFKVGAEVSRTDSHSGWVIDHRRPLVCADIETALDFPVERRLLDEGMLSYCIVPLILGGKSIGSLNVGSDVQGRVFRSRRGVPE